MDIEELVVKIRKRLTEYRYFSINRKVGPEVSIHVNALDISISLMEYAVIDKRRAIKKEDEGWFDAGLMLDYIFANSDWDDLYRMYHEMCKKVKANNFYREMKTQ